jgi:hypothetical protein
VLMKMTMIEKREKNGVVNEMKVKVTVCALD